jgi:hypothetical protein
MAATAAPKPVSSSRWARVTVGDHTPAQRLESDQQRQGQERQVKPEPQDRNGTGHPTGRRSAAHVSCHPSISSRAVSAGFLTCPSNIGTRREKYEQRRRDERGPRQGGDLR